MNQEKLEERLSQRVGVRMKEKSRPEKSERRSLNGYNGQMAKRGKFTFQRLILSEKIYDFNLV